MQFKLANIVFDAGGFLDESTSLLYRSMGAPGVGHAQLLEASPTSMPVFEFSGAMSFLTYFNALPIAKWRQYTSLENLGLHVELAGADCDIALVRANAQAETHMEVLGSYYQVANAPWQSFDLPISLDESVLVGMQLASAGTTQVRNAYFYTEVAPESVRPINLAVATTTFNNEDYIVPNIDLVRTGVLQSAEPIANHFHMFVVDNGRTLDAAALASDGVSVLPNPNVGGAGGFARGMLEALGEGTTGVHEPAFTHVLLMDDDVRVFPESFIRTFNVLSLANEAYQDAFVQGAMLKLQEPNIQFEDVSFIKRAGGYYRYKTNLDVAQLADMVTNETTPTEGKLSYGAWWYSCIPVAAIREHGLPLPLFIRIDDVEFGARCQPTYMCMSGICVWHSQFLGRFRASVDMYQYGRNMLIGLACDNFADTRTFMVKYWRNFQIYLREMAYETAELWLDALEDYLRGPEWLAAVDGAKLMKDNAQKNEKLVPVEELDARVMDQLDINFAWLGHEQLERSPLYKTLEMLPYDKHYVPDVLLKDEPAIIDASGSLSPGWATARRKTLVALSADGSLGHIRRLDKARHKALMKRYRILMADFTRRGARVAQAYRDAMPYLTSPAFWKDYLGLPTINS